MLMRDVGAEVFRRHQTVVTRSIRTNMASTSSPPNRSPTAHHSELNTGDDMQGGSAHDGTYGSSRSLSNLQAHVDESDHHSHPASHIHQHHLPPLHQHHPHHHTHPHPHHPHPHHPHHPHHHHLHLLSSRSESPYTNNNSLAASARTSMTRVDLEDQITAQLNQTRHMDSHDHERAPHTSLPSEPGFDTQQHMMDEDHHDAGTGIGAGGVVGSSSGAATFSGGEGVQDGTGTTVWEQAQGSSSYSATSATMPPTSAQASSLSPSALPQQQQQPTPSSPSTSAAAATSSQPQTQLQAQTNPGTVAPSSEASQLPPDASQSQSDQPETSHDHHHPPTPKVFLTFLLLSGQRRLMSFEPDMTVGRVKELVWNGWNSGLFTLFSFFYVSVTFDG